MPRSRLDEEVVRSEYFRATPEEKESVNAKSAESGLVGQEPGVGSAAFRRLMNLPL